MKNKNKLANEKKYKIIVTDSGLGGFSVYTALSRGLRNNSPATEVELIYFNAVPEEGVGFNQLNSEAEKIDALERVFNSMENRFRPGKIIIACNTLSVLYEKTKFGIENGGKIYGIVNSALSSAKRAIGDNPDANVVILGTGTTIDSGVYRNALINFTEEKKVISQACPLLETEIERGIDGKVTKIMLKKFLSEAESKMKRKSGSNILLLACTHYALIEKEILNIAVKTGIENPIIVNPNEAMAAGILTDIGAGVRGSINHRVVSKVKMNISPAGKIIAGQKDLPEETLAALMNYEYIPDLF